MYYKGIVYTSLIIPGWIKGSNGYTEKEYGFQLVITYR